MSTQTGNLGLYRNETVDDTLVALVNNQNINMNIIDSNLSKIEPLEIQVQNKLTTERLNKDANDIYTEIQYKRSDGTLFKKSVLSGGTSPQYTTKTVTYYATDGTTVTSTINYTLNYTGDDLTSEVIV